MMTPVHARLGWTEHGRTFSQQVRQSGAGTLGQMDARPGIYFPR